jgi:UDP-N-acetylglucosamine--N-acetylmuramyl-(pentapeptide) pyrophosphoryl-undecaprenol N-acetylglucosamine transferase
MAKYVVIAGGGTGGHLFPGIALAKSLKRYDMSTQITFVGTQQGIESKVLPKEGFKLKTILSGGLLGKKGASRWISWSKLPIGMAQSMAFLIKKRPNLVVGVGGYVSGPLVFSAWVLRIPILIHEQNSVPGVTNRLLGKIADKVAISFGMSKKYFPEEKVTETGNMIREEMTRPREEQINVSPGKTRVLILGGSQGAHSINMAMLDALDKLSHVKDQIEIVHQTGEKDETLAQEKYKEKGFAAEAHAFIDDIGEQYQKASLVICRAGATTLAEVTACGKVSVLIPFPYAAHNHQEHNARAVEAENAGEVILDKDINGDLIADSILEAMNDPEKMKEMEENSYQLGRREATEEVMRLCVELMNDANKSSKGKFPSKSSFSCF